MTTLNVSEGGYRIILKRKQEMEAEEQGIVSISRVLDSLLGVNEVMEAIKK